MIAFSREVTEVRTRGRTNVSVLDVLELTVQRGEELESLLYQEHINADSSRAKHPAHLPGELRVKRKPKVSQKTQLS